MVEGRGERKYGMRILKDDSSRWTDNARIFITAWAVYLAFWNPWLQASMTFSHLDAAVSLVDRGRWEMTHSDLYGRYDTVMVEGRVAPVNPPGVAIVVIPFYLAWKSVIAPVSTLDEFRLFHSVLVAVLGAPAMGLTWSKYPGWRPCGGRHVQADCGRRHCSGSGRPVFSSGPVCGRKALRRLV